MTLTDMAEFAVTVPGSPTRRYTLLDVFCALCGFDEITEMHDAIVCAGCFARVCILCGCVDERACEGGCWWILPGVCSTHEGDARVAALAIPATSVQPLGAMN